MSGRSMKLFMATLCALTLLAVGCAQKPLIRFKAVYVDMDGTSLDSKHEVRPATQKALANFRKCGGKVGVATGRTTEQVLPELPKYGANLPLVLYNGAMITDSSAQKIMFVKTLSTGALDILVEKMPALEHVQNIVVHYPEFNVALKDTPEIRKFQNDVKLTIRNYCEEISGCVKEDMKKGILPVKILIITSVGKTDSLSEQLRNSLGPSAHVAISTKNIVEILPAGADKGSALARIIGDNNLTKDDVVVFGDNQNDVEMLKLFSVGIAMGNCRSGACESALLVTGTSGIDGISGAILSGKCKKALEGSNNAYAISEAVRSDSCAAEILKNGTNDTDAIANVIRYLIMTPECRGKIQNETQK